jgi:hypothetical protein
MFYCYIAPPNLRRNPGLNFSGTKKKTLPSCLNSELPFKSLVIYSYYQSRTLPFYIGTNRIRNGPYFCHWHSTQNEWALKISRTRSKRPTQLPRLNWISRSSNHHLSKPGPSVENHTLIRLSSDNGCGGESTSVGTSGAFQLQLPNTAACCSCSGITAPVW